MCSKLHFGFDLIREFELEAIMEQLMALAKDCEMASVKNKMSEWNDENHDANRVGPPRGEC